MSAHWLAVFALLAVFVCWSAASPQTPPGAPPGPAPPPAGEPGVPAPPEIVAELHQGLAEAIRRFEAMDTEGVLRHVSDRYRSGPLTKRAVREQLRAMFTAHDVVRARVRIDDVRVIGDRYWVYSTGEVTGRLRFIGTPTALLGWEREPEVVWREDGRWRLIGDQQP